MLVFNLTMYCPVVGAPVSQWFGDRAETYKHFGLAGHEGIDYACPIGTNVFAIADGSVWRSGNSKGPWGIRTILKHEWGYSVYAHLENTIVVVGQTVSAKQQIGLSGKSGNVTGPHLHLAVALPRFNSGYACPPVMGKHWWHDPLEIGDVEWEVRGVPIVRTSVSEKHCCIANRYTEDDVW